jgi:hypothetical protein
MPATLSGSKISEIMRSNPTTGAAAGTGSSTGSKSQSINSSNEKDENESNSLPIPNNNNTNSKSSRTTSTTNSIAGDKSLPSFVCLEGKDTVFNHMVGQVVREKIFPKQQFIILDRELDENGKLADKCVQALSLERSKWYSVRNMIRIRLNRTRNNAQQTVRKRLLRKFVVVLFFFTQ